MGSIIIQNWLKEKFVAKDDKTIDIQKSNDIFSSFGEFIEITTVAKILLLVLGKSYTTVILLLMVLSIMVIGPIFCDQALYIYTCI